MTVVLKRALVIFILSAVFSSAAAFADTIYLKNGGKIKGKVIKDNGSTLTIDVGGGTVVQNKADVVRIKAEVLQLKEPEAPKAAREESATPMFDTKKTKRGVLGTIEGVIDTAFSILKFDFLKKNK